MSRTLYLHIGTSKTGTSALQVFFSRNLDPLLKYNIKYPDSSTQEIAMSGKVTSGNAIGLAKYLCPTNPHRVDPEKEFGKFLNELKGNDHDLLYSSEFLMSALPENLENLLSIVLKCSVNVKIIVYLRDYFQFYISAYSQFIKTHRFTGTLLDYIRTHGCGQRRIIEKYCQFVGKNNVSVGIYDSVRERLCEDMLDRLGITRDDEFKMILSNVNRGLSKFERLIMRELNQYFNSDTQGILASNIILEMPSDEDGGTQSMNSSCYEMILNRHREDIEFINQQYFHGCDGLPMEYPHVEDDEKDDFLDEKDKIILRLLAFSLTKS